MNQFNPYAAMSAEQLQGVAQQQSLENIARQKAFIEGRRGDINQLAAQPVQGNAFLAPLAQLTDTWTGSNFSKQAANMGGDAQNRLEMIQKIENSLANSEGSLNRSTNDLMDAALREKLAKQQNALLSQRIGSMGEKNNLKDYEYKAAQMGQRASLAEDQYNSALERAAAEGYNPISRGASFDKSSIGKAANFLGVNDINPIQKEIDSSERAFLISTLRDESGAAIGVQEADNQRDIYFPRFGDSPEAIANKAQLREAAKAGLEVKAGKAWGKVDAKINSAGVTPKAAAPKAPTIGEVRSGHKYLGGDPSSPSSWEKQ
jgi:hypothetical protein